MNPLLSVVREIELHASREGWDQADRVFAVVDTADLIAREPQLAGAIEPDQPWTSIEQERVPEGVESMLPSIVWPAEVAGCAVVVERLVLPPGADGQVPEDAVDARTFAAGHPDREEVRIALAVLRGGETACALRLRSHDADEEVLTGPDLVPGLVELLRSTLEATDGGDRR